MIITCPACTTHFRVDGARIRPSGTKVRCAQCGHVWVQRPAEEVVAAPSASSGVSRNADKRPSPRDRAGGEAAPSAGQKRRSAQPPEPAKPRVKAPATEPAARAEPDARRSERPRRAERADLRPIRAAIAGTEPEIAPERRGLGARLGRAVGWLILLGGVGSLLYFGHINRLDVVRWWPRLAVVYEQLGYDINLVGIAIRNQTFARLVEDGRPILELRGELVNERDAVVTVPRLRAGVFDTADKEISNWTFAALTSRLGPHEVTNFVSRVPGPPGEARMVEIRLLPAED